MENEYESEEGKHMNRPNHLARWVAAGVSALALSGAGHAAATTTPPSEPPDTTMSTADTAMSASSEPVTGAGPSDCPAVTEETAGSEAPATSEAMAGTEAPAASDTAATTDAPATSEPMASQGPAATTGDTMASGESAPAASGPFVQIVETDEYGPILVDGECRTLYGFMQDADGEPTCVDDCATKWPPLLVDDESVPPLADELDPSLFSVVDHPDGPMLKVGDWPLYHFSGDTAPGDITGQGMGGVWFVVAPDGTLVETEEGAEGSQAPASPAPADTAVATTEG